MLAIMPILPILCVCENPEWVMFAQEIFKGRKRYNGPMISSPDSGESKGNVTLFNSIYFFSEKKSIRSMVPFSIWHPVL